MKNKYVLSMYFIILWLISIVYSTGALDNKKMLLALLPGAIIVLVGAIYVVFKKKYKDIDKKEYIFIGGLLTVYLIASIATMGFSFRELYFVYVVLIGVMLIAPVLIYKNEYDSTKLFFEAVTYISCVAGIFGLICYYNEISIFIGTSRFGFTDDFINAKGILSIMTNTNSYALICVISLMVSVILLTMKNNGKYKVYFLYFNILLQGYCLVLTASRTAMLMLLTFVGFYFLIFFKHKYKKRILLGLAIISFTFIVMIAVGIIPKDIAIINKFTSGDISSGRSELWKAGIDGFLQNPVFGVGIRNSLTTIGQYLGVENNTLGVHNGYIAVLLANGAIVFVAILSVIGFYIFDSIRYNKNKKHGVVCVELMICSILAMLVGNVTESILFGDFNFPILMIWVMLMLQRRLSKVENL